MTLFFLLLNLTVDYFYFENLFSNCIMKNKLYSKVRADVLKQLYSRFFVDFCRCISGSILGECAEFEC